MPSNQQQILLTGFLVRRWLFRNRTLNGAKAETRLIGPKYNSRLTPIEV